MRRSRHSYSRSRSRSRRSSRTFSRTPSPGEDGGYRLHIADLGMDCSKHEIERKFERFGPLIEVWLTRNPPCFAFVVFRHRNDAEDAIHEVNGKPLCGSRVRVTWARPRTRGMRRGFDPNMRCYQCGEKGHFSRDCDGSRRVSRTMRRSYSRSRSRSPRPRRSRDWYSRERSPRDRRRRYSSERRSPPRYYD